MLFPLVPRFLLKLYLFETVAVVNFGKIIWRLSNVNTFLFINI